MNTENKWEISYKGIQFALEKHTEKVSSAQFVRRECDLFYQMTKVKILMTKSSEVSKENMMLVPGGKVFGDLQSYLEVRGNEAELMVAVMAAAKLEAKQETGTEIENLELVQKNSCGATVEWDLYYVSADIKEVEQELDGDEKHHGIEISFTQKVKFLT